MMKGEKSHPAMVASGSGSKTYKQPEIDPDSIKSLVQRLKSERGFDLDSYKPRLFQRRLLVRLRARSCPDLAAYLGVLESDPTEVDALIKALTINVSEFFRNVSTYWFLRDRVLPRMLEGRRKTGERLLLVSAGCAHGEEPYSLAILIRHYFGREALKRRVRIVGIDVDADVLEGARRAEYDAARTKNLPEGLAGRCFKSRGREYILRDEIKNAVEFFSCDLREELPLSGIDLAMCRNMLIYFKREHQTMILKRLLDSLSSGGHLVLGKTETMPGQLRSAFSVVDRSERIYKKAGE